MSADKLTLQKLLDILRQRGFRIELRPDGSASLRGDRAQATPALMRVVAMYRYELIEELKRGKSS